MKLLMTSTAIVMAMGVTGANAQNCPESVPGGNVTCNISAITDENSPITNTQNIGDHVANTYAPDSSTSNSNSSIGDIKNVAQGGTGGNSSAHGNLSNNDNRATVGNTTQSNGNINNNVTGGSLTQGGMQGGSFQQGNMQGGSNNQGDITGGSNNQAIVGGSNFQDIRGGGNQQGDITGGNASGGTNTTNLNGGTATTNSGSVSTGDSSVANAGNSSSRSSARGGNQQQSSSSNNSGGNSQNANQQRTNIDASTRTTYKEAANTVIAPQLNGYGPGNCFGDTNPSGSFTAGMGTIGWQATAGSSKASNACAIMMAEERAMMGRPALAAYLAAQDRNAHKALTQAGIVRKPSQVRAEKSEQAARARSMPYTTCEIRDGRPYVMAKTGRRDEALSACLAILGGGNAQVESVRRTNVPVCPLGSSWDGKGCWAPRR